MGAKLNQAWADIKGVGQDAIDDVGNSYMAILTQDSAVPVRLNATPREEAEAGQEVQEQEVEQGEGMVGLSEGADGPDRPDVDLD